MVMFMDAYDVLVFPAVIKAAAVLAQSPTPIVFCAERGVYPEMPGIIYVVLSCVGYIMWSYLILVKYLPSYHVPINLCI